MSKNLLDGFSIVMRGSDRGSIRAAEEFFRVLNESVPGVDSEEKAGKVTIRDNVHQSLQFLLDYDEKNTLHENLSVVIEMGGMNESAFKVKERGEDIAYSTVESIEEAIFIGEETDVTIKEEDAVLVDRDDHKTDSTATLISTTTITPDSWPESTTSTPDQGGTEEVSPVRGQATPVNLRQRHRSAAAPLLDQPHSTPAPDGEVSPEIMEAVEHLVLDTSAMPTTVEDVVDLHEGVDLRQQMSPRDALMARIMKQASRTQAESALGSVDLTVLSKDNAAVIARAVARHEHKIRPSITTWRTAWQRYQQEEADAKEHSAALNEQRNHAFQQWALDEIARLQREFDQVHPELSAHEISRQEEAHDEIVAQAQQECDTRAQDAREAIRKVLEARDGLPDVAQAIRALHQAADARQLYLDGLRLLASGDEQTPELADDQAAALSSPEHDEPRREAPHARAFNEDWDEPLVEDDATPGRHSRAEDHITEDTSVQAADKDPEKDEPHLDFSEVEGFPGDQGTVQDLDGSGETDDEPEKNKRRWAVGIATAGVIVAVGVGIGGFVWPGYLKDSHDPSSAAMEANEQVVTDKSDNSGLWRVGDTLDVVSGGNIISVRIVAFNNSDEGGALAANDLGEQFSVTQNQLDKFAATHPEQFDGRKANETPEPEQRPADAPPAGEPAPEDPADNNADADAVATQ